MCTNKKIMSALDFIKQYGEASNASSGSKFDANANVSSKNISTLTAEIHKGVFIRDNRELMVWRLTQMYGKETADSYLELLENHFIYKNDETSIANYCASITMYPFLLDGTRMLGGSSNAPKNLKSFCGGFINLVFMVSSQLAGACATPEFLMYFDYFVRKEYGDDYYKHSDKVVDLSSFGRTIDKVITDCFEQIVYSLNQPTGARNYQAVFWNISYYDKFYFESIFGNFKFPDGSDPIFDSLWWLQKRFMMWLNNERTKTILTFPVETMAMLVDEDGKAKDEVCGDFTAEMYSEGHSFFTYLSQNADSLSSCCRLRNEITDNEFSYTLGAGGVSTGSKSVLTVNVNRCLQKGSFEFLDHVVRQCHIYQTAYNENLKMLMGYGLLPLFDNGFINMSRQYLTIGINGLVEGAEFLGIDISDNEEYRQYVEKVLGCVEKYNKEFRTSELMFNCEMIPAENVGVKHAKWDREDGYFVPRDCYNSYFYIVESDRYNILDKIRLHGGKYIKHLTGGSALHLNLDEHLSKEQYATLLQTCGKEGCNYFTFNIPNTICNECGHITKHNLDHCPSCGSKNIDKVTRIIGYIKRVSCFSEPRQKEANKRHYHIK